MEKIRLRAIAKLPFGILLGIVPNLISTQKTETLWGAQKSIIYLHPTSGTPENPSGLLHEWPRQGYNSYIDICTEVSSMS
jgi:hypothetical protein